MKRGVEKKHFEGGALKDGGELLMSLISVRRGSSCMQPTVVLSDLWSLLFVRRYFLKPALERLGWLVSECIDA